MARDPVAQTGPWLSHYPSKLITGIGSSVSCARKTLSQQARVNTNITKAAGSTIVQVVALRYT